MNDSTGKTTLRQEGPSTCRTIMSTHHTSKQKRYSDENNSGSHGLNKLHTYSIRYKLNSLLLEQNNEVKFNAKEDLISNRQDTRGTSTMI